MGGTDLQIEETQIRVALSVGAKQGRTKDQSAQEIERQKAAWPKGEKDKSLFWYKHPTSVGARTGVFFAERELYYIACPQTVTAPAHLKVLTSLECEDTV